VVRDDQPDAREGQAGRRGDAEGFVVPLKPGNAGGGKGPQFKTNANRAAYLLEDATEADAEFRLFRAGLPASGRSDKVKRTLAT